MFTSNYVTLATEFCFGNFISSHSLVSLWGTSSVAYSDEDFISELNENYHISGDPPACLSVCLIKCISSKEQIPKYIFNSLSLFLQSLVITEPLF